MSDELREKAKAWTDDREFDCVISMNHYEEFTAALTSFAAECVRAERERADKLNAALVEIEQRYIANPNGCPSCYDLASIATLNKDICN